MPEPRLKMTVISEDGSETTAEGSSYFGIMLHRDNPAHLATLFHEALEDDYAELASVLANFLRHLPDDFRAMVITSVVVENQK